MFNEPEKRELVMEIPPAISAVFKMTPEYVPSVMFRLPPTISESMESDSSNVEPENPIDVGLRSRFITNFPKNLQSKMPNTRISTASRRSTSSSNRAPWIRTPSGGTADRYGSCVRIAPRKSPPSLRRSSSKRSFVCRPESFLVLNSASKSAGRPWQICCHAQTSDLLHAFGTDAL